jgi:hypothetical protein
MRGNLPKNFIENKAAQAMSKLAARTNKKTFKRSTSHGASKTAHKQHERTTS